MKERGPQVTEADVAAFEQRLGHTIPDAYRRFLFDVNGGGLALTHRRFARGSVNWLLSLNDPDDQSNIEIRTQDAPDIPSAALLYAGNDDGGARLFVVLAGDHRGEVWLQDRTDARPDDANPRVEWQDRRDMKKLASSFDEFMSSLRPHSPLGDHPRSGHL